MGRSPGSLAVKRTEWKRSLAKSATWKILGVSTLVAVSVGSGISLQKIGAVTLLYHFVTLFLYVAHEKAWDKSKWGK